MATDAPNTSQHVPFPPCICTGCKAETIYADARRVEIMTILTAMDDIDVQYSFTDDNLRFVNAEIRR